MKTRKHNFRLARHLLRTAVVYLTRLPVARRKPEQDKGRRCTMGQMVDRRKVLTFSLLLLVATGSCPRPAAAQNRAPASSEHSGRSWLNPSQQAEIDGLFARPPVSPGYAVAVIKDGDFALSRGYGLANLDDGIPITPETAFHLASLSKQFTGAAIVLLTLEHKIALTDPVSKYIPEAAKYGDGLRIEHLVYMTSGLHEYTDLPRASGDPWMTFANHFEFVGGLVINEAAEASQRG
jgi:CubicO group peptidase (beta-lactamase class C family)